MNILVAVDTKASFFPTFFDKKALDKLKNTGTVYFFDETPTPETIAEKIKGIDVLITGWGTPAIDENILKNADKLKYILHTGGTVASLVNDAVYDKGITVMSGNEIYARSVAEGVIAYILSALRNIPRIEQSLQLKGQWENLNNEENHNRSLIDKTVGIVSFGTISRYLVPLLSAFGVKILLYSRKTLPDEYKDKYNITQTDLETLFSSCDIVTVQTAQNPDTLNMINEKHFSLLKDGALFVNTARGGIINTASLIKELKTGRISAILDVFNSEPLEKDNPLIGMENVFLMPHMAGPTVDLRSKVTQTLIDCIKKHKSGEDVIFIIDRQKAKEMTR